MTGLSDFTMKMNQVLDAAPHREMIQGYLSENGYCNPDLDSIAYTYQKLIHNLHRQIQQLNAPDPRVLPRVCAFPTGSLMMGHPSTNPYKILVFGSISPNNYHDLVWEAIQKAPEYAIFESGITEMQKLPVMRFVITFDGYRFDLQYHQSVRLINHYKSEICALTIIDTPSSVIKQICTKQVAEALLEVKKHAQMWKDFENEPQLKYRYYIYRAWASLNGVFNDAMDTEIMDSLILDCDFPDHPIFCELSLYAPKNQLKFLSDKNWDSLLHQWHTTPLSSRMQASNFVVISVFHHSLSDVQSSQWLKHVEKRLPVLEDRLARVNVAASVFSDRMSAGRAILRLDRQRLKLESQLPGPSRESKELDTTHLPPLFDLCTWETLSFDMLGQSLEARAMHRQDAIRRLQIHNSPNPQFLLPPLETNAEMFTNLRIPSTSHKSQSMKRPSTLESDEIDGGATDLPEFNVGTIQKRIQLQQRDQLRRWPTRQVFSVDDKFDNSHGFYKGHYILSYRLHSPDEFDQIKRIITSWQREVSNHETVLWPGGVSNCTIGFTMLQPQVFKQWDDGGNIQPCDRILADLFLDPPNAPIPLASYPQRPGKVKNSQPEESKPTPSLRRASEILSRLRHDSAFNIDEYYIGYKDRFVEELMEMPARNWVKETTNEEFVPEGRIWYFRRTQQGKGEEGEIMWDRERKIDMICGSGVVGLKK